MRRSIRFAAIAMMLLVITLPIAFAQSLTVEAFGAQGKPAGFAENGDPITITVLASIPGDAGIDPGQVRLISSSQFEQPFDTCEPAGGAARCTISGTMGIDFASGEYEIILRTDANTEVASVLRNITVDSTPPTLTRFSAQPPTSRENPITIRYTADDFGGVLGETQTCAGIRILNITANNIPVAQVQGGAYVCHMEEYRDVQLPLSGDFGLFTVCGQPIDMMGRAGNMLCTQATIDGRAPIFDNLTFTTSQGAPLAHVRPGVPTIVDVHIIVLGDPAPNRTVSDVETVTADFSSLNPSLGVRGADDRIGDTFIWRSIEITQPQNCLIVGRAEDLTQNAATKNLFCRLEADSRGPDALRVTGIGERGGLPVKNGTGTLKVLLEEFDNNNRPGAGLNRRDIFLDLREFGMSDAVRASACTRTDGAQWLCDFPWNPTVESGRYTVRTNAASRDDVGNVMARSLAQEILLDRDGPREMRIVNRTILHGEQSLGETILTGDTLEYTVEARGFNRVAADFTELGGANNTPGACNLTAITLNNEGGGTCTFRTTVLRSGPFTGTARFIFSDDVGNIGILDDSVPVFGIDLDQNPNHWRAVNVQCSPRAIDRSVTTLINTKAYCRVTLAPFGAGDQSIVSTRLGDLSQCGPAEAVTGSVAEMQLFNAFAGSREPVIALLLERKDFQNELRFTCPLQILSRVGNRVTAFPETENVTLTLQFYNQPLGELSTNLDKEIDEEIEKAQDSLKWVGILQKFADIASKICQIKNLIANLLLLKDTLLALVGRVAKSLVPHPVAFKIDTLRAAACGGPVSSGESFLRDKVFPYVDKFCDFMNCQHTAAKPASGLLGIVPQLGGAGLGGMCSNIQSGVNSFVTGSGGTIGNVPKGDLPKGGYDVSSLGQPIDTKESLVWSLACLCVPGIIHNLNKYRQIQCEYGLCLAREVREKGVPISFCKDQKEYMTCNFVMNQVFNAIPFTALYNQFVGILKNMFSNPFDAFAAISGVLCRLACRGAWNEAYTPCIVLKTAAKVTDAVKSVKSIISGDWFSTRNDACDELDDAVEEQRGGNQTRSGIFGGIFG